ncbi:MAG: hypothetical protein D6798_03655 [Deltaproteobacteria bacterium]|nr:MAG: hypothetical protein D6798_03655 [Deltaproteobacteria bacterium]
MSLAPRNPTPAATRGRAAPMGPTAAAAGRGHPARRSSSSRLSSPSVADAHCDPCGLDLTAGGCSDRGMLPLLLLACSTPLPSISTIEPDSGPPGTTIVVTGNNLVEGTVVRLGRQELADLTVSPPDRVEGRVPEGIPAGTVDLVVVTPAGQRVSRSKAFEVTAAEEPDPCGSKERRMTHIPPTADVVKIDRWVTDDEVERSEIPTRDIQAVVYEQTERPGGGSCAAIWLQTKGSRVLFDAQADADLAQQAQKIANGLGKPLELAASTAP